MPFFRRRPLAHLAGAAALLVLVSLALPASARVSKTFRRKQLKASRVVDARARVGARVRAMFEVKGVKYPARELLLRSLKRDRELELWATDEAGGEMVLIKSFAICADSGELGPKRKAGDLQVPEGFYVVDRYNAWSNFHLSLGLNYPNKADKIVGRSKGFKKLGYNIFIHGDCVTIGCVPLEDGPVEELYLAALDTRLAYEENLEVHMLPGRMDDAGLRALIDDGEPDDEMLEFWHQLKLGWDAFESTQKRPRIKVDKRGRYVVKQR